jgi:hypothetical protein
MKFETRMSDTRRRAFIADCALASCTHSLAEHISAMQAPARLVTAPVDEAQGAVVSGSLLAFAEGVSRQNKEDVMDSFLFSTLVANKAFNPETESPQWYGKFNTVLAALGWFSSSWSYARYRSTHQRFTMDQVGLEILASIVAAASLPGPASVAMLKVAGDAVKALQAQEQPLRLFERQTKMHKGAHSRVGACAQSEDGTVNVAMGAVNFLAASTVTDVLFWEWSSSEVAVYRGEDCLALNTRLYAGHRDLVKQRLGDNAKSAIEEFDI